MTSYALYLHIPFCRQRCSYCDFNTYTTLGGLQDAYTVALAREIRQVGDLAREAGDPAPGVGTPGVHTIFFGGGTPSLLTPRQVETILTAAREAFLVAPGAEITMEANPGTVDAAYLAAVRALGVNRLSYGVQSALPGELALLGREHDFAGAVAAVGMARAAGFDNLNLDLIYGLPGQSVADWQSTLSVVLPLDVEHISLYCLTIEPGTPMQRWLQNGAINAPDPDVAADQYELACRELARAGFAHYEISNWARPGRECRHNIVYWRNEPYLGLGAGAHGLAGGYRYQVVRQPRAYVRRMEMMDDGRRLTTDHQPLTTNHRTVVFPLSSAVAAYHPVGRDEAMSDTAITQLRLLREGLDLAAFADRFGQGFDDVYGDTVRRLEEWDMLHRQDGHLLLTERGRFLSNQVFYRFV
jgi:oxygen-independent coproporphyrinogen-3 oxidase